MVGSGREEEYDQVEETEVAMLILSAVKVAIFVVTVNVVVAV